MGLYVHLPFCRSKCGYCDFVSYPGMAAEIPAYVKGLAIESRLYREVYSGRTFDTVYLGGGTPSLLPPAELAALMSLLHELPLTKAPEITMEANPESLDPAKLQAFIAGGGNRLSLGVQTHEPRLLAGIGRRGGTSQAARAAAQARAAGVASLSLDLMYGLPGQSVADWEQTLAFALTLAPEHVSAYCLELHPGTDLHARVTAGAVSLPAEEETAAMFQAARTTLDRAGLLRYEVTNHARPGQECQHNLHYWRREEYLGLGAAAHSHVCGKRWGNVPGIGDYLAALQRGERPVAFCEELGPEQKQLECLMLGLRLTPGISQADFAAVFGRSPQEVFGRTLAALVDGRMLALDGGRLRLTDRGALLADRVLRTLVNALPAGAPSP